MMVGREATWRACLLLTLASGGCDYIFRVDHISLHIDSSVADDSDGALVDASVDDVPPMLIDAANACASPIFYEPFKGTTACTSFGIAYSTNAVMTQDNGVLSITPNNSGAMEPVGGCNTSLNNLAWGSGLTAIVNASVLGTGSYTNLLARGANAQIQVDNGQLRFETQNNGANIGAVVPYNPIAMKWWRLKTVTGPAIRAEYSADGAMWTQLGTDYLVSPPATIGIEITAGTITIGDVGTSVIDQIMICP